MLGYKVDYFVAYLFGVGYAFFLKVFQGGFGDGGERGGGFLRGERLHAVVDAEGVYLGYLRGGGAGGEEYEGENYFSHPDNSIKDGGFPIEAKGPKMRRHLPADGLGLKVCRPGPLAGCAGAL